MKVKVRRSYFGAEGKTHRGQELDITEPRFRQLTEGIHARNPLVDAMEVGYKMQAPPKNKMEPSPPANKEAPGSSISFRRLSKLDLKGVSVGYGKEAAKEGAADPTPAPPLGGPTGAVSAASLSEPDPQRVKRSYTRRAARPE